MTKLESPSLRGSGLKLSYRVIANAGDFVSLFTREWIEIPAGRSIPIRNMRLPLYEGVD